MGEAYRRLKDGRLPWLFFYAGLTVELLVVLVEKSSYTNPIEGQFFRVTFLLFAMKLLLTDYTKKEWAAILLLEAAAFVSYRVTGGNDLIRAVTFAAACKNIPLRQMLRYVFYVTLAGCVVIILLSVTGLYGDVSLTQVYGRSGGEEARYASRYAMDEAYQETRYTLGMGHPNTLACMFLMLVILGIYLWSASMKWYGYLAVMGLNAGVYALTGSKTCGLITAAFIAGACILTYCKRLRQWKLSYLCGLFVLLLCIGFSVDAAAYAQQVRDAQWNIYFLGHEPKSAHIALLTKLDDGITGRISSLTDTEQNDGTLPTWSLFSEPDHRVHYFDMGWVKLFYCYGIIPAALSIGFCLLFLWKLYRHRDGCGLLLFTVLAVYTVIEAHLVSPYLGRNYVLMIAAYYLFTAKTPSVTAAEKEEKG